MSLINDKQYTSIEKKEKKGKKKYKEFFPKRILCSCSSVSPEPSCVSVKRDQCTPVELNGGDLSSDEGFQPERSDSPAPSVISIKSIKSMTTPIHLKNGESLPDQRLNSSAPSVWSLKSDKSMTTPIHLKNEKSSNEKRDLTAPSVFFIKHEYSWSTETIRSHQRHDQPPLQEILQIFKSQMKIKYQYILEGLAKQENPTPLNEIYTELYITESESGEISNEHEVRQIEKQSRRTATEDTPIKCNDIFKPLHEQDKPIRSVLTKGVAGIGKTVSVQKFILDWAEGKENQDVHLIFPLPFREINLMKNQTLSLLDLLHLFFPETKEMEISSGEYKVLFIFDGLDECRVSLDFHSSVKLCDVSESASVDVMLTNLMAGNLLPSSLIWITSRPAAADLIPSECVDRVTEVRGFTDKQKEEYFSKRISDESLNNRIKLNKCGITAEGCVALASALSSKTSCLTDLDLSVNVLQDSGVKLISAGLKNLHCKLKILRLSNCSVTKEGVVALAEALNSNPSHLTELHLQENHLKESDINLLSTIQDKVII